jgi:glutathione S-transferase
MMRLYTIPMSHYAEKARFALVRVGRPWGEERHLQGFHYLTSFRLARTPYLPILRDGGEVICDSTAIVRHLDRYLDPHRRLFPDGKLGDEVAALEEAFDVALGVHSRKLVYFHMAEMRDLFFAVAAEGTPRWEQRLFRLLYGLARRGVFQRLSINDATIAESRDGVLRAFDRVDGLLAGGGRYLIGDRFTAADLGFACLAAPVILPPGYGIQLPDPSVTPESFRALVSELRARPAGAFVLRVFQDERRPVPDA